MHNEMEELLPVVAKLAERYTSKESSSVSYKTAEQLMGAVVYCINEVAGKSAEYMLQGRRAGAASSYEAGYRIVLEKTGRAKEIYHHIIEGFDDYGCKNYKETIASGMPAFFTLYDPVFHPQDHILTLDYPVLQMECGKKGVDLILDYLSQIEYEQRFLRSFYRPGIVNLLESTCPDYKELYLDNICLPVLFRALACMITERPLFELELDGEGQSETEGYFLDMPAETIERQVSHLLDLLEKAVMKESYAGRFRYCARELSVRIKNHARF
ncbi:MULTISPECIES: DUF6179 domain-containing protein [Clostridia]|uniref:DUF6179 domain-containing protein n=1 Tax=Clostridia TaxID=186801 RepID=UPI00067F5CD9|nr:MULTISPECIES: DUF6179 domain-containing protein [Clostridia]